MVYMVSMVVVSVESGSEVVGAEVVGTELGGWVGGVQAGGGVTGAVVVGGGVGGGHVGGIGGGVGQVEQLSSTEFPVLHPVHSRHCPATYIVAGTVEIVAELPIWALAVGVAQAVPLGVWPGLHAPLMVWQPPSSPQCCGWAQFPRGSWMAKPSADRAQLSVEVMGQPLQLSSMESPCMLRTTHEIG